MSRRPTHAVVTSASLDVRARPDHAGELTSQLLTGETVRVLGGSRAGDWWRVRNDTDGYTGWVRAWGLRGASRSRTATWRRLARGRILSARTPVTVERSGGHPLGPLYWNAAVIPLRTVGRRRHVELPDARRGWLPAAAIGVGRRGRPTLIERVRLLLGTPYLWGGRTAMGLDCSALSQQLLAEQGIALPRDARHQFRATRAIPSGEEPAEGDLVFFRNRRGVAAHVGVCLGGGYYVQARGTVRISSLHERNILYDKELSGSIMGVRRLP